MNRTCQTLASVALGLLLFAVPTFAQEGAEGMPPMGPTQELKELGWMQGEWTAEMQFRQMPDAPWETSTATCTISSVMDGCIQRTDFQSTLMGMAFGGEETLTYNREKKQYESIWIDSMSARPTYTAGIFEDGKLVMSGEDIMMGMPYKMRTTSVKVSDTQMDWTMEMSMDGGATWFESMKATYKKKS